MIARPAVQSGLHRLRSPLLSAGAVAVVSVALHLRDPHQHTWVICPFKALTGWDCPFCGGLRGVVDLTGGHVSAAAHSNLILVASLPLVLLGWLWWVRRAWAGDRRPLPPALLRVGVAISAVVLVSFTLYRNTPAGRSLYVD